MNSMMLMPCWPSAGPTGGAAVAAPAGAWTFSIARIFFAIGSPSEVQTRPLRSLPLPGRRLLTPRTGSVLQLLDLQEVELHRGLAAEDADQHLDLVLLRVDLVDRADELGERTVLDANALTLLVLDLELRRLDPHLLEDLLDLCLVEGQRSVPGADEARHARGVPHHVPALVAHRHLHQHVAGKDLAIHGLALAVADLDLLLHRDEDLEDLVLHAHRLDAVLEIGLYLVLVARVRVDDVPLLLRALRLRHVAGPRGLARETGGLARLVHRRLGGRLVGHQITWSMSVL